MATAPPLISIDEYLHTSYHPDVHFVDGEIEERNLGEFQHARLQALIASLFIANEKVWNVQTVVEQRIRVAPSRVRICDISLLHAAAPREPVTLTPPLLCLEILSPEDRLSRAQVILTDYLAMGVAHIWLVDPMRRAAYTYDTAGLHIANPTRLSVPETRILLDLTGPFEALD